MDETTPADTLQDLLNWSARLHDWQRHGLRCLVAGSLPNESLADTLELCRLAQDLPAGESPFLTPPTQPSPAAIPLSAADLPRSKEISAPVSLIRVEKVNHVNALASNQNLVFAQTGLTIVYGDNASGKSGYARILKRACRARERGNDLLTNVYDPPSDPDARPSATIHYRVGDGERKIDWVDGRATSFELPFVQVFDSGCARVQVTEKNDVIFTPFALELLQRLGDLCGMVKEQLQAERAIVEARASKQLERRIKEIKPETEAGRSVSVLSHSLDLAALRRLGSFTKAEAKRRDELEHLLARNPAKLAAEARQERSAIQSVARMLWAVEQGLSVDVLTKLHLADSDWRAKAVAASLAATKLFDAQPLPGIGSDTWRALWNSARSYSTAEAYPEKPFPLTGAGAVCVLCHQALDADASERLQSFEAFVRADTQRSADAAKRNLDLLVESLRDLDIPKSSKSQPFGLDDPVAKEVRRFLVLAKLRRRAALRACATESWGAPLPELSTSPAGTVSTTVARLDDRIEELERAAQSDERRKFEDELAELDNRLRLKLLLPDLETEVDRLMHLHQIDEAIRSTDTRRISRKSTEIAKSVVTDRLRDQFARELERLRVRHARVELAHVATAHGTPQFKAQLLAKPTASLGRILSEGEHTCVALAGFLAELAITQHKSALVFDDPVSSLDHNWRRHVAERLAEESRQRQVIVFTHDTVFLMALSEAAGRKEVDLSVVHLERRNEVTGIVFEGAPWSTMRVTERIAILRKKIDEARPHWGKGDSHIYEPLARDIYGLLREAWERGVEELLLNQVVLRFGRTVQTNRLKPLVDIAQGDIDAVDAAMSKCSTFLRGHDDAPAINEIVPGLPELEEDLNHFDGWVKGMRKRKRS